MDKVELLHGECIGCVAALNDTKRTCEDEAILMLILIKVGHSVDDLWEGLCFAHRRIAEGALQTYKRKK